MRVEKLFSHVAVEMPVVKAAAYKEKMFGKASLNSNIICAALANDVSLGSFFNKNADPTLSSAATASE